MSPVHATAASNVGSNDELHRGDDPVMSTLGLYAVAQPEEERRLASALAGIYCITDLAICVSQLRRSFWKVCRRAEKKWL